MQPGAKHFFALFARFSPILFAADGLSLYFDRFLTGISFRAVANGLELVRLSS
jgi:hypothetical protein